MSLHRFFVLPSKPAEQLPFFRVFLVSKGKREASEGGVLRSRSLPSSLRSLKNREKITPVLQRYFPVSACSSAAGIITGWIFRRSSPLVFPVPFDPFLVFSDLFSWNDLCCVPILTSQYPRGRCRWLQIYWQCLYKNRKQTKNQPLNLNFNKGFIVRIQPSLPLQEDAKRWETLPPFVIDPKLVVNSTICSNVITHHFLM